MNELDFYNIEECRHSSDCRFVSLYNGTRGIWVCGEKRAIKEGEKHKALVIALNPGTAVHESYIWNKAVCRVLNVYQGHDVTSIQEVIDYLFAEVGAIRNNEQKGTS